MCHDDSNPFEPVVAPEYRQLLEEKLNRLETYYQALANTMWAAFTDNEKAGVRFGLLPAEAIARAEKEVLAAGEIFNGQLMACALLNCAQRDGGMRV